MQASATVLTPSGMPAAAGDFLRWALLALFVLSGFSALIYQSIWTHYLGLMLGHAAYAQTLVLIMFMGGMALGSWWVSRRTLQIARLVGCYAAVEALIGLLGFAFHPFFTTLSSWNLDHAFPALGSAGLAETWQWVSAGALIAPQTVLLGATFPLIAGGVLRAFPQAATSAQLGGLYFTNGIGAALGALVATFILLPKVGMQGALQVAAATNLLLALATVLASAALREGERRRSLPAAAAEPSPSGPPLRSALRPAVLVATFASSAASFGYEIGWVRLLNQALGTTLHGFELMLAAFITGLALGGLWVQRRGTRISDPMRYAGFAQVAMGVAALISVPVLAGSFAWVGWLMQALSPSDAGYTLYSLATALTAMVVMLPAACFAGMTLPLFTAALLREGGGERVVGQVYAANTVGAIAGVALMVHVLIPLVGIVLAVVLAACLDVAIGVVLLRRFAASQWRVSGRIASLGALIVLAAVMAMGLPDPLHQAAGVFRSGGALGNPGSLVYFKDGSTATVSVRAQGSVLTIATNGKPDAGLTSFEQPPSPDEITMLMLAALPLAAHPEPKQVAIIGWGSGMSTHTLLGSSRPERVDTIEIEPAMVEGARSFLPRNARAYGDPRSHIHIEDARQFFAVQGERYDVIVSEPSNPWVSGVSSLFTQQFYRLAKRQLSDDGVFVQWIHTYEMSDPLLAQMLAALIEEFPDSEVFQSNQGDLVVLAHKGKRHGVSDHPWETGELASELRRVGLGSLHDLRARRIGGAALLRTYVRHFAAAAHSDYWPTVALNAPAERFKRQGAFLLGHIALGGAPLLRVLECQQLLASEHAVLRIGDADSVGTAYARARFAAAALLQRQRHPALADLDASLANAIDALLAQRDGRVGFSAPLAQAQLTAIALATFNALDTPTLQALWEPDAWQVPTWQPDAASQGLIRLYAAVSRTDWPQTEVLARILLEGEGSALQGVAHDLVVVLGLLSHAARGDSAASEAWLGRYASRPMRPEWRQLAEFAMTWVRREPSCGGPG